MSHTTHLHTRHRKTSILNTVTVSTTTSHPPSKLTGLHVSNSRVSITRSSHSRLLNLTLPLLNRPGSCIRKALPTVSLTHASVNVSAAATSCVCTDIVNIDCQSSRTQQQYDYHDHYLPSTNVCDYDLPQSQNINIIPFPSSVPPSITSFAMAGCVGPTHRNVNVDVKTLSDLDHLSKQQPPPYSQRRIPRRALAAQIHKSKSGSKSSTRTSKAKHLRVRAGSSPSSSRKSHKRLAADVQFLETVYRSIASHRVGKLCTDGERDRDAVMDVQECLLLQRLSDLMIELGHRVPTALSCRSQAQVLSPSAGQEPEDDTGVESTSPDDCAPPSLPIPLTVLRTMVSSPSLPTVCTPDSPEASPGLSFRTLAHHPAVLPKVLTSPMPSVPPPLSSPPLPTVSLSPPVLSMPQLVAALTLRRRDGTRRRQEWGGVRVGRTKSRLGIEARTRGCGEDGYPDHDCA